MATQSPHATQETWSTWAIAPLDINSFLASTVQARDTAACACAMDSSTNLGPCAMPAR